MTVVSVCIPTVPARESLLTRAVWSAQRFAGVEVLVAPGDRPMGDKLNEMFARASGRMVVALDDDDMLIGDWRTAIQLAGEYAPDFIGWRVLWTEDGRYAGSVAHRHGGDQSWSGYERGVSPKCAVATEIARSVPFWNDYTADRPWSATVQEQVGSAAFVDDHLYHYDHWNAHMVGTSPDDARYTSVQRYVGMWPMDEERITWVV